MQQLTFFKCLADETRLNIVLLVSAHQELCVCELTKKLALSQPKISRHLALLRSSGLLVDRRQGQWVYYRLHPELEAWCHSILDTLLTAEQNQALIQIGQSIPSCCE